MGHYRKTWTSLARYLYISGLLQRITQTSTSDLYTCCSLFQANLLLSKNNGNTESAKSSCPPAHEGCCTVLQVRPSHAYNTLRGTHDVTQPQPPPTPTISQLCWKSIQCFFHCNSRPNSNRCTRNFRLLCVIILFSLTILRLPPSYAKVCLKKSYSSFTYFAVNQINIWLIFARWGLKFKKIIFLLN